ncbi:rod shape-determining protein MreD [Chondrinema litorale]|uniref:rod shape-determining protein MreD n=1 Tax=Chondrinema litorale TaxID=2994555 RepID=UPI002543F25F|nr:rod shape-determining protein MreD [Chondrinema litorale]UZR95536.1 rod shape-determining protein MreD [Chondrinema litorale]
MNRKSIFFFIYSFILYVLIQVLFLKYVDFYGYAFCFAYIGYLLAYPLDFPRFPYLLIAFFLGITVDIFYDSAGIHAASCVFLAYMRNRVVKGFAPTGGYETGSNPNLLDMGINWYITYTVLLAFLHHLVLFFISASNLNLVGTTLIKTFFSVLFTTFILFLGQRISVTYQQYQRRRRR